MITVDESNREDPNLMRLDFAQISGLELSDGGNELDIRGSGSCYEAGSKCESLDRVHYLAIASEQRLRAAVEYFRSEFCKVRSPL